MGGGCSPTPDGKWKLLFPVAHFLLVLKRLGQPFLFSVRFRHGTGNDQVPLAAPRHHSTDERCRPDHKFSSREASHRRLGKRKLLNFIVFSC